MPSVARRPRVPSLRHHKSTSRGVVTLSGKDFYCGKWNADLVVAPKSVRDEYDRITGIWLANGRSWPRTGESISIAKLVVKYVSHVEGYYVRDDGSETSEVANIKTVLKVVVQLFGPTNSDAFKPADLKIVRQRFIDAGKVRKQINKAVSRVVRMFRWAAEEDLIAGDVWQKLRAVAGLKRGRSEAVESEPVKPVSDRDINAVVAHSSPAIAAMIRLQQLSGCRPGEVVQLTTRSIDRTGEVWRFVPLRHKTQHHGKDRIIYFGPQAQAILGPWLNEADPDASLFSPKRTLAETRDKRRLNRKIKLGYGNSVGTNVAEKPERAPGDHYTVNSYGHAVVKACQKAFGMPADLIEPRGKGKQTQTPIQRVDRRKRRSEWRREHCWRPNQIRHSAATKFRREFGLEAAQVLLGHSNVETTQIYAEINERRATEIAARIG